MFTGFHSMFIQQKEGEKNRGIVQSDFDVLKFLYTENTICGLFNLGNYTDVKLIQLN